jgi:hypothetical protein
MEERTGNCGCGVENKMFGFLSCSVLWDVGNDCEDNPMEGTRPRFESGK